MYLLSIYDSIYLITHGNSVFMLMTSLLIFTVHSKSDTECNVQV